MDVKELQHKLFPLHPLTLEEFKSQSRIAAQTFDCEQNESLFWRVLAEDMTEDQVCVPALPLLPPYCHSLPRRVQVSNVFYFATNWHTLAGNENRRVNIAFERRSNGNMLPLASTCGYCITFTAHDCISRCMSQLPLAAGRSGCRTSFSPATLPLTSPLLARA